MGRIAKDPEIRKKEIIEAAEALFSEKGFVQTSVSDITDRVGLSHGAFFYYFKSKDDLLKAVITYRVEQSLAGIEKLLAEVGPDPLRKIQLLLELSTRGMNEDDKFIEYMHAEGNAPIHAEYVRQSEARVVPLIAGIVEEGVREGIFDVEYPREWVELIVPIFDSMQHKPKAMSNEEYYRKMRALYSLLARSLGISESALAVRYRR